MAHDTGAVRPVAAVGIYGQLLARVTEFVRRWRTEHGTEANATFVALAFECGEACQFDWNEDSTCAVGQVSTRSDRSKRNDRSKEKAAINVVFAKNL
ncbi:hypothetical protein O4G98_11945 [Zoogloeaceae bacterium G21618-S1]|nr:hypothetical protein [Zoogloeaceae bacterium G21618-S1]